MSCNYVQIEKNWTFSRNYPQIGEYTFVSFDFTPMDPTFMMEMQPMNISGFHETSGQGLTEWLANIRPDLQRYCRSLTRSEWEAEDLAQDTLLKVLAHTQRDEAVAGPEGNREINRAYVFRTARNLWIDGYRKTGRRQLEVFEEGKAGAVVHLDEYPHDMEELLQTLLKVLMPKTFVILLLCDVYQFTAKEAGACIDMSEVAVQVALSRARGKLRQFAGVFGGQPVTRAEHKIHAARAGSGSPEKLQQLLEAVIHAFEGHDPQLIHYAYMRLFDNGIPVDSIRLLDGKLVFTIIDPSGNPLMVTS
ncbi:RNA polymerase sigma factor [Paenibacillus tarimensis]|uniref:RNA polymerase sigma factor n=1 Tax=Paenibacillus tarimensis TaxID=416012 RepID=UPI001F2C78FC|nr:RNA polymerase sigma factor [Paenibacillus tarimensis]